MMGMKDDKDNNALKGFVTKPLPAYEPWNVFIRDQCLVVLASDLVI